MPEPAPRRAPLRIFVGSGGVGKTTLAAAAGVESAAGGVDTLVMTFDPSLRLKDALGVGEPVRGEEVDVPLAARGAGTLRASLLDPRRTFDRLVSRYAPDAAAERRILENRYYDHLAGHLGGILEYMAVERLYEVAEEGRYRQVILDTPPARQAIDFLEAPRRIVDFLDSGALRVALKPWFDAEGRFKAGGLPFLGRGLERFLDQAVGMELLRDMSEFFQAFEPLFAGFRRRAEEVEALLASPDTEFVLVSGPGAERIPDTLFFARRLLDAGYHLGPVVVNRVHPELPAPPAVGAADGVAADELAGRRLFHWLGERHHRGLEELRRRLRDRRVVAMPLERGEPTDLASLARMGDRLAAAVAAAG